MNEATENAMKLRVSATLRNEWEVRAIGDVIPALASINYSQPVIEVDDEVAQQIAADCEFYINPKAVDATVGERAAYRAMLKQIRGQK